MRKRIISLVLALTMICAMAISVSAAQYNYMGEYNGSLYEVLDNCTSSSYSSTMFCDSSAYSLQSYVTVYAKSTAGTSLKLGTFTSSASATYNTVSASSLTVVVTGITCEHYVNGDWVHSNSVQP